MYKFLYSRKACSWQRQLLRESYMLKRKETNTTDMKTNSLMTTGTFLLFNVCWENSTPFWCKEVLLMMKIDDFKADAQDML